jgi:hypothetical protein
MAYDIDGRSSKGDSHSMISTTMGIIPIVLLIILLIQKEIMRAYDGRHAGAGARIINVALVPLALASAMVIVLHVVYLVQHG